jgi:hypothetical protein
LPGCTTASLAESWIAGGNIGLPADLEENVQIWPVTTRMNSSKYEEADSIEPLGAAL